MAGSFGFGSALRRRAIGIGAMACAIVACGVPLAIRAEEGSTDVRLRVVVYPVSGVGATATAAVPFTAQDVVANVYTPLIDNIRTSRPLYSVCSYDLSKPPSDCDPSIANVLVTLQFTPDPKSPKPDMLDPNVDAKRLADLLNQFFVNSKVGLQHILFGTDRIMLGMSDAYPSYTTTLHDFFGKYCNLGADAISGIFIDNSRRFFPPRVVSKFPVMG